MWHFPKTRAVYSKFLHYQTDGTGRDTYIKCIEGGLTSKQKMLEISKKTPQPVLHQWNNKNKRSTTCFRATSNTFYFSDGSGRDNYVCYNDGGNSQPHHWRNHVDFKFKESLRQPIENNSQIRSQQLTNKKFHGKILDDVKWQRELD